MTLTSRSLLLGGCFLLNSGRLGAGGQSDFSCEFSTAKHVVAMRVSFPPAYEGKRLVVYRSTDPQNEDCLSIETGASRCTEHFVGTVAIVVFTVHRLGSGKPAAASIRELVTVVDQSPGLPERPPFAMRINLAKGVASDLQVFGYDESAAPPAERAAERQAAKAAWRRYRQNLYLDEEPEPFAVIDWLHTTTRIQILRVQAPSRPQQGNSGNQELGGQALVPGLCADER